MNTPTFEQLPLLVANLINEVSELKALLLKKSEQPTEPNDELLTIEQACGLLKLSTPTIYSKVAKRELTVMKRGKRLYFSKKELTEYIKQGRKKTVSEINDEADTYLSNNKNTI